MKMFISNIEYKQRLITISMKILVLSPTARTCQIFIEEALKKDHQIHAIARNPEKIKESKVKVFKGSPYESESVDEAIEGCDAVISGLNISRTSDNPWAKLRSPKDLISRSIANTVAAMKKHQVNRVVVIGAFGIGESMNEIIGPWFFKLMIKNSNLMYAFRDHYRQEQILRNSGLDWTVIKPVMLTNEDAVKPVLINIGDDTRLKNKITRKSVAVFMLDCLENGKYVKEKPAVSNN